MIRLERTLADIQIGQLFAFPGGQPRRRIRDDAYTSQLGYVTTFGDHGGMAECELLTLDIGDAVVDTWDYARYLIRGVHRDEAGEVVEYTLIRMRQNGKPDGRSRERRFGLLDSWTGHKEDLARLWPWDFRVTPREEDDDGER